MKKLFTILVLTLLLVGCSAKSNDSSQVENTDQLKKIGVIQLMDHTSLNLIYDSFKEELFSLGYSEDNLDFINANGDMINVENGVNQLKADGVDVIVAITTPVAQYAKSVENDIPVTFAAVSDPVAAGIVDSMDNPGLMTGTSDSISVASIMDLALEFVPEAKSVGYLYNAGEMNSVSNLEKLKSYADGHDLKIIESTVTNFSELQTAAAVLADKVDFVFVANDNTVAEGMQVVAEEVKKANKLVFVGADSMVMDGGFATVGIDYSDLGKANAHIVDEILNGKTTNEIAIKEFDTDLNIYVNQAYADQLDIDISDDIINNDKYVEIQ